MRNTDYILRQTLENYQSPYSSIVLDNVLDVINKEDKRRYPVWMFLTGASILLASVFTISYYHFNEGPAPTLVSTAPNNLETIASLLIEDTKEIKTVNAVPEKDIEALANVELKSDLIQAITTVGEEKNIKSSIEKEINKVKTKAPSQIELKKSIAEPQLLENITKEGRESISKLNIASIPQLSSLNVLNYTRPFDYGEPLGCPNFSGEVRSPIFLEAYISHDVPFRTLSDNSAEPQLAYINERNRTESASYSFHTGARVSSNLIGNIVLRIGIDYAQITEKFKVTNLESTREIIVRDADGNIISTTTEQGFRDIVNYNKFKSLNIPATLGYQKYIGKMALSVHGGVAFNITSEHNGIILDSGVMPMARVISSGSDAELAAFKRDIGMSAIGSIGISYPFKEKIDFLIEPNFKFILDDINLASYPIHQHMFTVGLLTGIRYKF